MIRSACALLVTAVAVAAYGVTTEEKAFFAALRAAVLVDDSERVARFVFYPIKVRAPGWEIDLQRDGGMGRCIDVRYPS